MTCLALGGNCGPMGGRAPRGELEPGLLLLPAMTRCGASVPRAAAPRKLAPRLKNWRRVSRRTYSSKSGVGEKGLKGSGIITSQSRANGVCPETLETSKMRDSVVEPYEKY